jgi:hypothetical protein
MEVERKKCNRCKMNLTFDKFNKKRDDSYMKLCIECNIKNINFINKNKCEHGKKKSKCKDCGGASICEHDRIRSQCKECGGASICEHKRQRSHCKDCGGASICEHKRERSKCKDCKDPIKITIKNWIINSKKSDKKSNRFDIINFIDKCFCKNLVEEYPNCYYCSVELQYKIYQDDLATIERLDNSLGHIKSNCVIACKMCNVSKVGN